MKRFSGDLFVPRSEPRTPVWMVPTGTFVYISYMVVILTVGNGVFLATRQLVSLFCDFYFVTILVQCVRIKVN